MACVVKTEALLKRPLGIGPRGRFLLSRLGEENRPVAETFKRAFNPYEKGHPETGGLLCFARNCTY